MTAAPARPRLLASAVLIVTFVAGALAGAAVERVLSGEDPEQEQEHVRERDERSYVIDRVDMDADQRAAIDSILARRSERMRSIWRETRPRMDAITDSARAEIIEVLTPDQQAEYERRLEERRERYRRERD